MNHSKMILKNFSRSQARILLSISLVTKKVICIKERFFFIKVCQILIPRSRFYCIPGVTTYAEKLLFSFSLGAKSGFVSELYTEYPQKLDKTIENMLSRNAYMSIWLNLIKN